MTGLAFAWAMARRRPMEYRRKVARRRAAPAYVPTPDLTSLTYGITPGLNGPDFLFETVSTRRDNFGFETSFQI